MQGDHMQRASTFHEQHTPQQYYGPGVCWYGVQSCRWYRITLHIHLIAVLRYPGGPWISLSWSHKRNQLSTPMLAALGAERRQKVVQSSFCLATAYQQIGFLPVWPRTPWQYDVRIPATNAAGKLLGGSSSLVTGWQPWLVGPPVGLSHL